MKRLDLDRLVHSATYYLNYLDRIGKGFMIDESSLKYPIADYLTGIHFPSDRIKLEYLHPTLKKRNIDLATTKCSSNDIETAFELKLAQISTKYEAEQKRIFNDLMRLYLLAKTSNVVCYFLIVGKYVDFIQRFRSILDVRPITSSKTLPEPAGIYTEWFSFQPKGQKTFSVQGATEPQYMNIYHSFLEEYTSRDASSPLSLPDQITTRCLAISAISRNFQIPYLGGIWQVS